MEIHPHVLAGAKAADDAASWTCDSGHHLQVWAGSILAARRSTAPVIPMACKEMN